MLSAILQKFQVKTQVEIEKRLFPCICLIQKEKFGTERKLN